MRIEIILLLITSAVIFHIYTEGKYFKRLFLYKKYYQMGGVILGALFLYYVIKKNPLNAKNILMTSNDYIKYLPVDRNTTSMLSPILDFTSKHGFAQEASNYDAGSYNNPILQIPSGGGGIRAGNQYAENRIINSGKKSTKRSVSETKKKFVASRQNWKCGDCSEQLNAWFEVDHKIRLEYGGSNHVDNLLALCRECHGKKTTIENL